MNDSSAILSPEYVVVMMSSTPMLKRLGALNHYFKAIIREYDSCSPGRLKVALEDPEDLYVARACLTLID